MGVMDFIGLGKKVDVSVPRKMYWSDELKDDGYCPVCNSKLKRQYARYMVMVKTEVKYVSYLGGNRKGLFCPKCPVVVLDFGVFAKSASGMIGDCCSYWFGVSGIIAKGTVPPDKSHLSIVAGGNTFQLVEFIPDKNRAGLSRSRFGARRRLKREHRVKSGIGRNEPCLCGSGKKYKNCCG